MHLYYALSLAKKYFVFPTVLRHTLQIGTKPGPRLSEKADPGPLEIGFS